ncbi:B mating type pheromone [Trametes versicolor FP-101664 SS1]|uniref:B mating type pheromone n=1 Tax=Trametes versicolor (strain FP-101664) TaxID=717944 RepID=UPI000462164F|nr:B mating type pheromone [Trametes versicolor FP-101664 SS1]EIW57112.1 B mating type pheromone [Trametes versicolor FP-101664 SS1]
MDDFFLITAASSTDTVDSFSLDDPHSDISSPSPELSPRDRSILLAHLTSSAPVNEDRIEGYNTYCVIA